VGLYSENRGSTEITMGLYSENRGSTEITMGLYSVTVLLHCDTENTKFAIKTEPAGPFDSVLG